MPKVDFREDETHEFKAIWTDDALKDLAAFANDQGSTNRDMTPEEIAQCALQQSGQTWDKLASSLALDRLDEEAVKRFLSLSKERLPEISTDEAPQYVLDKLDLLSDNRLTHAGLLLFGQNPQKQFLSAQVRVGRFREGEILDDFAAKGTIWEQLDATMERLKSHMHVRFSVDSQEASVEGLQRKEIWDYPLDALREAIVNALIHRDYVAAGDITIRMFDDRLEIWNPGELFQGITVEELRQENHPSRLRNPLLAQAFYFAKLVERWGTGTTRMIKACQAQGMPEPQFQEEAGGFKIVFHRDKFSQGQLEALGLNDRQIEAVLHIKQKGSINNTEYQEITGVSKRTATRDLQALEEKGLLEKKGETGKGTRYLLKGPLWDHSGKLERLSKRKTEPFTIIKNKLNLIFQPLFSNNHLAA